MAVAFPGSPPLLSVPLSLPLPPCTTLTSQHIPGKVCSVLLGKGFTVARLILNSSCISRPENQDGGTKHCAPRARAQGGCFTALCCVSSGGHDSGNSVWFIDVLEHPVDTSNPE